MPVPRASAASSSASSCCWRASTRSISRATSSCSVVRVCCSAARRRWRAAASSWRACADGALLAQLGDLALQAVGVLGEAGALADQPLEVGGGRRQLAFQAGDLALQLGELGLALQDAGRRGLALQVEGAGLHPESLAGEERRAGEGAGQPLGVLAGTHQEAGRQGGGQLGREAERLADGEHHRGIVDLLRSQGLIGMISASGARGALLDQAGGGAAGEGAGDLQGAAAGGQQHGVGERPEVEVEAVLPAGEGARLAGQEDRLGDAGPGEGLDQGAALLGVGARQLGEQPPALAGAGQLLLQAALLLRRLGLAA